MPETKDNTYERKCIMKNVMFAYEYECEAVLHSEEYGWASYLISR